MLKNQKVYCPIHQAWVFALPEECVRQHFIQHMINDCGFPISLISVEQHLRQLPHLITTDLKKVPDRRADIICFANHESGLSPLLIVECKAIKLSQQVVNQVASYNRFVMAFFIAIVSLNDMRVGYYDAYEQEYVYVDYLPTFQHLIGLKQQLVTKK